MTFSWFTNGTCAGTGGGDVVPVHADAGGVADGTTFTQTPRRAGSFAFQATYSGDGTYNGSTGPCEPLTVTQVASTTVTVIHDANARDGDVGAGGDDGARPGDRDRRRSATPTGTVTFSWFTNGTCTAPAAATSSAFTLAGGVADGTTFTQTPSVSGRFAFRATYSGDGTYTGSTGPCEPLTVDARLRRRRRR